MPLSDLFKKSLKKEPVRDDPFGSPELQKRRYDAAMEFLGVLQANFLSSDGEGHAGTVLSVAAWLTGTSLYRSLNYKHNPAPGVMMLSNEVNEVGPKIMSIFQYYLHQNGIDLRPDQLILNPPDEHKPLKDILQIQNEFQDQYHEIMKKHGLDYLDGAKAGTIICSIVFHYHCVKRQDMDPRLGAGMISMGIITAAKTSPMPLKPEGSISLPADKAESKSRLVLGERDAAIQEALDNGGFFIDPGTEVLRMLQQGNIDPYLIYEKAMLQKIEEKIPRIDFVKADVDKLFDEWKSQEGAPIHVRLILWLKNNAKTYGYEQNGNSWVLKY